LPKITWNWIVFNLVFKIVKWITVKGLGGVAVTWTILWKKDRKQLRKIESRFLTKRKGKKKCKSNKKEKEEIEQFQGHCFRRSDQVHGQYFFEVKTDKYLRHLRTNAVAAFIFFFCKIRWKLGWVFLLFCFPFIVIVQNLLFLINCFRGLNGLDKQNIIQWIWRQKTKHRVKRKKASPLINSFIHVESSLCEIIIYNKYNIIVMSKLLLKLWKSNRQFALYLLHLNQKAKKIW